MIIRKFERRIGNFAKGDGNLKSKTEPKIGGDGTNLSVSSEQTRGREKIEKWRGIGEGNTSI